MYVSVSSLTIVSPFSIGIQDITSVRKMSAFKKSHKAQQKPHRERAQPKAREHLGILEKSSDYKKRARNFHNKQETLKILQKKALERNPDEFYHKMIHKKLKDGEHWIDKKRPDEETMTEAQRKLMHTQDMNYIKMKLQMEKKKLEKLSQVVDFDQKPSGKRIIFVDSDKEAKRMKLTEDTPSYLEIEFPAAAKEHREKLKEEIEKRELRRNELRIIADKMESHQLLKDSSVKRELIEKESKQSAPIYKWQTVRKR